MPSAGVGIVREYRKYKKTPMARRLWPVVLPMFAMFHATSHGGAFGWADLLVAAFIALAIARTALYLQRGRTLVDPDGITVRRALTERTRAWSAIYDIRAEPVHNALRYDRHWLTYVYDTEGRRLLLPHIDDWQLDNPPAEVAGLLAVGAPYRGMAWARRPEVEALIRQRAAHRRAWLWAFYGALIVFGCMTVLSIGLSFTSDGPPVVLLTMLVPLGSFVLFAALFHVGWKYLVPRDQRKA
ncbi:PH domain-containing protein [Streptomyces sp. DSM 118148]|uniref:PH domain-containing protein n=1 Tax=Streptomyces sp. DSM 118148 TaxID=3448667 RepID=UPI0040401B25